MRFFSPHVTVKLKLTLVMALLPFATTDARAVSDPPTEHTHFIAEHLAEAAQDARYYSMPWPTGDYSAKGWRPVVSVAGSRISADLAAANGGLLTIGVSKNWGDRWATEVVVYRDRFSIDGGQSENSLLPFALNNVPLDLPERAIFSSPRGELTHTGIGIIASHGFDIQGSSWNWDSIGGLLFEQLDLSNYRFDYELISGADAGATGVLDHSGRNDFIYFLIGIQARKPVANHYIVIPRLIYGQPVDKGDFATRLTGPGFELTTASTGAKPQNIGDPFAYIGMTVRDTRNHFEADLGALLGFAAYEYIAHEGIGSAIVVSLTWRI